MEPTPTITTLDENCDVETEVSFRVELTTDYYASETSWDIKDVDENLIESSGAYSDKYKFFIHAFCLEKNGCYIFTIYDSCGDGFYYVEDDDDESLVPGYEIFFQNMLIKAGGNNHAFKQESSIPFGDTCPSSSPSKSPSPSTSPKATE